ncbi:transcription factor GTE1 [Ziziphus jujuba]|uniref:Transcription factor GTE1 n=1 Tax=Ziziphus jujuba TaxID=326968 RepID=A0A6P3Z1R9_ZIZJJ|nr:transcription factor GTE1 [Ziziphus jujuba]
MEPINSLNPEIMDVDPGKLDGNAAKVEDFRNRIDEIFTKVDKLEKRVNEVEEFYSATCNTHVTTSKGSLTVKDKEREKHFISVKKQQQDASRREAAAAKRMQELMRQFATILRQITQHKWAWPFMEPVDVQGLGLDDYYEVIDKPMDFGTIKSKMEAKDASGYRNVREVYADVRLVFKNAMKYNDEKDDVHVMAKTLLEKFEEKWLQLLPKVAEEEKRLEEEEAEAQRDMQLAQEVAYANMARDISNELCQVDHHLKNLRETVVQKCRKMSAEEKKKLGTALTRLSPEDLNKALEIVAENNPSFQATAQEVDLDIDAQSEYTLWRLKVFVKEALKGQADNGGKNIVTNSNNDDNKKNNSKRRKELCDALAKNAVKRTKKISSL